MRALRALQAWPGASKWHESSHREHAGPADFDTGTIWPYAASSIDR